MQETGHTVPLSMTYFATNNIEDEPCGDSRDYFNVPSLDVNLQICEEDSESFKVYARYDSPLRIVAIEALSDDLDPDPAVETVKYLFDVIGGEGSGLFSESEMVFAVANVPSDREFVRWEYNQNITIDETSEDVAFPMPPESVILKANFRPKRELRELIVIGGSGSGTYPSGIEVPIAAEKKQGLVFSHWSGDTSTVINNEIAQSFLILDKDVVIQAEFVSGPGEGPDVTGAVTISVLSWTLDQNTGALVATIQITNNGQSGRPLEPPFWFAIPESNDISLANPTGTTTDGLTYTDVNAQVTSQLPTIGNGDQKLDAGESATFTVAFFTPDRSIPEGSIYPILFRGNNTALELGIDTFYPVYRFFSPVLLKHLYTIDENEKATLIANSSDVWQFEGAAYYGFLPQQYDAASDAEKSTLMAVHRFYSESLHTHLYTIDENEKAHLIANAADVWRYEGPAFYVPASSQAGMVPVYRFYSEALLVHLFTVDENEKNHLIDNASDVWRFEGIAYYAYP